MHFFLYIYFFNYNYQLNASTPLDIRKDAVIKQTQIFFPSTFRSKYQYYLQVSQN